MVYTLTVTMCNSINKLLKVSPTVILRESSRVNLHRVKEKINVFPGEKNQQQQRKEKHKGIMENKLRLKSWEYLGDRRCLTILSKSSPPLTNSRIIYIFVLLAKT